MGIEFLLAITFGAALMAAAMALPLRKLWRELSHERSLRLEGERELAALREREILRGELQTRQANDFEMLSRRMLEESGEKLQKLSRESLGGLLQPLDSELKRLQGQIREVYDREARERLSLQKEIELMMRAQERMTQEASSLTKALRGDVKTQGTWGEVVLERILESSGLREGEEYIVQGRGLGLKTDEGRVQRPDVLVRLPGDRHLIVDSKVSLSAYEAYVRAGSEPERQVELKKFSESLRRHVDDLSSKDYASLYGLASPDFVMLFVPTDGAFALAHQNDPELFQKAMAARVAIVSPSLLFPNLRTVESLWRRERQNENAEEIARQAGNLYDKFALLLEDLESVGENLRRTDAAYQAVVQKLRSGKGNLLDRVEKLRQLGAKTKKQLSDLPGIEP